MGRTKDLFIQMQQEFINTCNQVEQGEISMLDAVLCFREARKIAEEYLSNIKSFEDENLQAIETEAERWQNEYKNAKFEFRSGGYSYDFSKIEEYKIARDNLKEIEDKYKTAYQNKIKGIAMYDEQTGEELPLPEVKPRKSSLIIKF